MATKKTGKLHYDKEALHKEYNHTFHIMMKAMVAIVGMALVYFFFMAMYLGGWGHTDHDTFVKQFGGEEGRIQTDYDGLKLPSEGGASIEDQKKEKGWDH